MLVGSGEMRSFKAGTAKVEIYPDAVSMGKAAARAVGEAIKEIERHHEMINVIFATGASQLGMLCALTKMKDLPWNHYFYTQWLVIWVYLRLYVLPYGQNADWDFPISRSANTNPHND